MLHNNNRPSYSTNNALLKVVALHHATDTPVCTRRRSSLSCLLIEMPYIEHSSDGSREIIVMSSDEESGEYVVHDESMLENDVEFLVQSPRNTGVDHIIRDEMILVNQPVERVILSEDTPRRQSTPPPKYSENAQEQL